jgi:hypothetical protein
MAKRKSERERFEEAWNAWIAWRLAKRDAKRRGKK